MNTQAKRLLELGINLDLFYVITIRGNEIELQGQATENVIREAKKLVELEFNSKVNYLQGYAKDLAITLTF
jgi:uncharacterized membrane protein